MTLLVMWWKWFDGYLAKEMSAAKLLKDMPPSWSPSVPLPIATVVMEGDAGMGKMFSINTLMRSLPNGTISSFAKKGTDAYLAYAMADTIPARINHVRENNTMCKMFKIKFSRIQVFKDTALVLSEER